jgi:uncharacterized protein
MLLEFSFANFRSFKEMTTLSMVAARISSRYEELDVENVHVIDAKLKLLKSKAIYGQNASGKSNLIKALVTFLRVIRHSVKSEDVINHLVQPFKLTSEWSEVPTFFQIIVSDVKDGTIYRYGFEVKDNKILSEWLFAKSGREEVPYFTREKMDIEVKNRFKEAKKFEQLTLKNDNEIFRDNSLFLTAVAAMGGTFAKNVISVIGDFTIISGLNDPHSKDVLSKMLQNQDAKNSILKLVRAADFDIENIEPILSQGESEDIDDEDMPEELKTLIQQGKIKKAPSFLTERAVLDANGIKVNTHSASLEEWESEGTKEFIRRAPFLLQTLSEGGTLVIDEFDSRLHPNLTKKIVSIFNSNRTNAKGAQLIFATHDTNLLRDGLRRDQICFVDKDKLKSSFIHTLVEFKGVRNDASFEKAYLNGEYGAVPFLNRFEQIFEN